MRFMAKEHQEMLGDLMSEVLGIPPLDWILVPLHNILFSLINSGSEAGQSLINHSQFYK